MEIIECYFGTGRDLNALQMSLRAAVIFFVTLVLIRVSGRRSFGMRTPLDNIIVILLGALLSRAVVGVSPFFPTVCAGTVLVLIHRLVGWCLSKSPKFSWLAQGDKIVLYQNRKFIHENMTRALVCEEDVLQGVRTSASTEDLSKIKIIYMERNGEISAIKNEP